MYCTTSHPRSPDPAMNVLIDIGHPAHVHFFRHPIEQLRAHGHRVAITSRDKECAIDLLDALGFEHQVLSRQRGGLLGLGLELVQRETALYRLSRGFRPDVMAEIGGIFVAHVGRLMGVPALAFYDTENATLQNALTYPFASAVVVPRCYTGYLPHRRHLRYPGYHELSYLHPDYFHPDRARALAAGLAPEGDTFLVRVVSWRANHDVGEKGWTRELLAGVIGRLAPLGRVILSAEHTTDPQFAPYAYRGPAADLHHLLAFCRLYVGESATIASEAAVLGVPAIYAAATRRGYTDEQEARYGLVKNVRRLTLGGINEAIDACLAQPREHWAQARIALLADTVDVAAFVTDCIERFPAPLREYQIGLGA